MKWDKQVGEVDIWKGKNGMYSVWDSDLFVLLYLLDGGKRIFKEVWISY